MGVRLQSLSTRDTLLMLRVAARLICGITVISYVVRQGWTSTVRASFLRSSGIAAMLNQSVRKLRQAPPRVELRDISLTAPAGGWIRRQKRRIALTLRDCFCFFLRVILIGELLLQIWTFLSFNWSSFHFFSFCFPNIGMLTSLIFFVLENFTNIFVSATLKLSETGSVHPNKH